MPPLGSSSSGFSPLQSLLGLFGKSKSPVTEEKRRSSGGLSVQPTQNQFTSISQPGSGGVSQQQLSNSMFFDPALGAIRSGTGEQIGSQVPRNTGGGGQVSGGGGGGGTAQPQVDQAKLGNLRKDIKTKLDLANKVFETLVGDIDDVLADRRRQVEEQFGSQEEQLTNQFNQEIPGLGRAFAARGLADSSFRENALQEAGNQFEALIGDVGREEKQALAQLGEFGATQKANVTADRGGIQDILARLPQIEDENQLLEQLDSAAQLVRDLQARRAGLQTDEGFVSGLQKATGGGTGLPQLQARLGQILQGQAPAPLKAQVAQGLIANSGLPSDQASKLFADFQSQLGVEDEEQVA